MLDLYQGFRLILSWLISGYAQLLETEMLHSRSFAWVISQLLPRLKASAEQCLIVKASCMETHQNKSALLSLAGGRGTGSCILTTFSSVR